VDGTANAQRSRAERRGEATAETRAAILEAARTCLLRDGYANLSTRNVAELAGVPLSQIHYHYGSKQDLILAILAAENERLLERQAAMYAGDEPLWRQWERACEFLELDLASGYVRILQEMIAAGWSDPTLAASVREQLGGWYRLLADVARREEQRAGSLGPFTPEEVAALMGLPFMGAEGAILLGIPESELPTRSALRKIGLVLRDLGERPRQVATAETAETGSHADGREPS
jgi:AcrR family transcriptional regulator